MTQAHLIARISEHYAPLPPACWEALFACAVLRTEPKQTLLVREGQLADKMYYLVQGCARAYYLKDGKEVTDWLAFEDELISPIVSFFGERPSPHYIDLLEDTVLIELSRAHMEQLAADYHAFERLIRIGVTKSLLQHQEKNAAAQFHDAAGRYANLLALRPDITQRVPLTHIASYLGMSLETLSRIRNPKRRI